MYKLRLAVGLLAVRVGIPLTWHMNAAEPHPPAKGLDSSFIEICTVHVLDLRDNGITGSLNLLNLINSHWHLPDGNRM